MSALSVEPRVIDGDLPALATEANREHSLVLEASGSMIVHAIKAGDALLAARAQVGHGGWTAWLEQNFTDRNVGTPRLYMRLARNKDLIVKRNVTGLKEAARLIRGAPDIRIDPALRESARELKRQGKTYPEIAATIGVGKITVYRWLNPEKDRRYRARSARLTMEGRRALQQRERERTVKAQGGPVGEAYALVRRALQALDQALTSEEGKDTKRAISTAINRLHIAEDEIVKASRLGGPLR